MVRFDLKASTLDFMRFSSLPSFTWQRGLITLAAYFGSGILAMVAAAPGSPVSQLYIAAGVALALTLGWGVSMLLPILLGGVGVVFFSRMSESEAVKDNAVANAAASVGDAAENVGDAAKDVANPAN